MKTKEITKLLPLNLQFFAEDDTSGADAGNSPDGALNTGEQAGATESQPTDHMIPKKRFDEINAKAKAAEEQLQKLLAEKAAAEKKAQEEQGKFQELYETTSKEYTDFKTQFEGVESRAKQLEGVIEGLLQTKLGAIPEELHDLVPEHLTPEGKLDWINKAEAKGIFGKKSHEPIGETTSPGQSQTIDLGTLSPVAMMRAAYGSKK